MKLAIGRHYKRSSKIILAERYAKELDYNTLQAHQGRSDDGPECLRSQIFGRYGLTRLQGRLVFPRSCWTFVGWIAEALRKRVLKFCMKKSWRLSAQDMKTVDPNFDELKEFVLTEAQVAQKQSVYDKRA
jgi:hypothetical protein